MVTEHDNVKWVHFGLATFVATVCTALLRLLFTLIPVTGQIQWLFAAACGGWVLVYTYVAASYSNERSNLSYVRGMPSWASVYEEYIARIKLYRGYFEEWKRFRIVLWFTPALIAAIFAIERILCWIGLNSFTVLQALILAILWGLFAVDIISTGFIARDLAIKRQPSWRRLLR